MRLWWLVLFSCLAAAPSCASDERICASIRSMAEGGPVPQDKVFYELVNENYVNTLQPDSVRGFLPWAQKLLQDPRPDARKAGLACFLVVTLRRSPDSQNLIEPYVPDLLGIVADRTSPLRTMAMRVLSSTLPSLSPTTLAYLAAHVADKDNTAQDTGWMACTLLKSGSNSLIIRDVIALVAKQNQHETVEAVLGCLRLYPVKNADVAAFIGLNLDSPDVWLRRRAVEAVDRMPLVERSPFLQQLNRLASDPREPSEIRSAAAEALNEMR